MGRRTFYAPVQEGHSKDSSEGHRLAASKVLLATQTGAHRRARYDEQLRSDSRRAVSVTPIQLDRARETSLNRLSWWAQALESK